MEYLWATRLRLGDKGYEFLETNEIAESINVSFDETSQPGLVCSVITVSPDDYTLFFSLVLMVIKKVL